jgi:hypothetical protein
MLGLFKYNWSWCGLTLLVAVTLSEQERCVAVISLVQLDFPDFSEVAQFPTARSLHS